MSATSKSGGRSAPDEGADAGGEPARGVLVGSLTGGRGQSRPEAGVLRPLSRPRREIPQRSEMIPVHAVLDDLPLARLAHDDRYRAGRHGFHRGDSEVLEALGVATLALSEP